MGCDSTQFLSTRADAAAVKSFRVATSITLGFQFFASPHLQVALCNAVPSNRQNPEAACLSHVSQGRSLTRLHTVAADPTQWLAITQTQASWMTWSIWGNLLSHLSADTWENRHGIINSGSTNMDTQKKKKKYVHRRKYKRANIFSS